LLVLTRLEAHAVDVVIERVDIRDMIEETTSSMNVLFQEKNIEVSYDFPSKPMIISMDEHSLQKVITNLLTNALRYAKSMVSWKVIEVGNTLEVSISNDGPMIPSDLQNKIFDRFQKGEQGNIGIGLAIVQSVMEHYGGHVRVQSDEESTSFILTFKK